MRAVYTLAGNKDSAKEGLDVGVAEGLDEEKTEEQEEKALVNIKRMTRSSTTLNHSGKDRLFEASNDLGMGWRGCEGALLVCCCFVCLSCFIESESFLSSGYQD